ncbi:hypothetical protein ACROYT_G002625 [Oculina patagonica]
MFGVTVERLISIRFPMKYDLLVTRRRAIATVVCIWIFSATCGAIWSKGILHKKYLGVKLTLILIGTVLIYFYIFRIAKRLEDSVIHLQNGSLDKETPNVRRERKAAKTIAIILGVAIGCWLPFLILPHIIPKGDLDNARYWKIFFPLHVLSVCNSSINPYIYCARSRRYFAAFVKLLRLQGVFNVQEAVGQVHLPHNRGNLQLSTSVIPNICKDS